MHDTYWCGVDDDDNALMHWMCCDGDVLSLAAVDRQPARPIDISSLSFGRTHARRKIQWLRCRHHPSSLWHYSHFDTLTMMNTCFFLACRSTSIHTSMIEADAMFHRGWREEMPDTRTTKVQICQLAISQFEMSISSHKPQNRQVTT